MGHQFRHRSRCVLAVAGLALATVAVGGCGDGGAPSATGESSSPSATPTPTGPPEQPNGAHSVTYQMKNWADFHDDPLALSFKQAAESYGSSVNDHTIYPEVRKLMAGKPGRYALENISFAWQHKLHTDAFAPFRVVSSHHSGSKGTLVTCTKSESSAFRNADGSIYGTEEKGWFRQRWTFRLRKGAWVATDATTTGDCKGVA